ncbi:MAG TPA: sensor histidine kinase [Steroidobacteraceae bacterium]
MRDLPNELAALADHLNIHHEAILIAWRRAILKDPDLTSGDSLPRSELFDHIPALLRAFEIGLRGASSTAERKAEADAHDQAAAHGLQRWQQGYDLREVSREWGKLNQCVLGELDRYATENSSISLDAMSRAREVWAILLSTGIETSVHQYFTLQQQEAVGHVKDLEKALEQVQALEQERGAVWQEAAHDLRGNLGVVANVTVGLTRHGPSDAKREDFIRILMRNVSSLHQLLDDVTNLARLQAGRESRRVEPLDATSVLESLCEGIRPLAQQRGLQLLAQGPRGLAIDGDAVKIRRIAQNLILNAVKYTREGCITVAWGDSNPGDLKRWMLSISDTGPGFHTASGQPLAAALDPAATPAASPPASGLASRPAAAVASGPDGELRSFLRGEAGEGIGLSIVKRLCEMLDATIEMESVKGQGTTFRILFPRHYES